MNYQKVMSKVIDRFRTKVSIKINNSTYSKYGDETISSTINDIYATINDVTGGEDWNMAGVYIPGDKIFFFKGDQKYIEVGNYVTFDGTDYEITMEPIKHVIGGVIQFIETRCKRV